MNCSTLLSNVADSINITAEEAKSLCGALADSVRDFCKALDAIAVPGFGTIQPVKRDEEIRTDLSDGSKILVPPCIEVEFKSSVVLRKRLLK